jgi:hypothetical protein
MEGLLEGEDVTKVFSGANDDGTVTTCATTELSYEVPATTSTREEPVVLP